MKVDYQHKKIITELSKKYNLSEESIIEILESPFKFIRKEIKEINLEEVVTEEEFNAATKNFNIPSIGKLYASHYNFKYLKNGRIKKGNNPTGD